MNKKIFKIMVIMIIMLLISAGLMNSTYAADEPNPCVVDFGRTYPITPSNPLPGQEITIQPVIKDITYPIATVSFVIDYDSTKIEFVSKEGTDEWDLDLIGTTFTATTKTKESTTKTGKLGTIKLKVKDDATKSDTVLKFTKVSAVGDDYKPISIGDISTTINISNKEDQYVNPPADTNNEPTNTVPDNNNNNNNANNNNNNPSNVQNTEKPATSSDVDNNKIVVVNGNTGNNNSTKNGDVSTATKNLPKTGVKTISILTIAIAMITMIISYRAYRKYKNI